MTTLEFIRLDGSEQRITALAPVTEWIRDYVRRPHPQIGRRGPVCPRVPLALQTGSIHLAAVAADDSTDANLRAWTHQLFEQFHHLPPKAPDDRDKTLGIVITGAHDCQLCEQVNLVQSELKAQFLEAGLLLGKFHRYLTTRAVHNPEFVPGRSPAPMIMLRYLIQSDINLMLGSGAPPSVKLRYLHSYLRHMGDSCTATELAQVKQEIAHLSSLSPDPAHIEENRQ